MTKADVLSGFSELKICTAYKINGERVDRIPYDINVEFEPIFTSFKGWDEEITASTDFATLPQELKEYITFIEKEVKVPITIISVGPDRSQIIRRANRVK